jgi:predicted  nucleic acid-binding Zn-ribbon protein
MIQAKQRELERLEAEQEDVSRRHLQELDDSASELQALTARSSACKSTGLQLAQGRAELALSNYRPPRAT